MLSQSEVVGSVSEWLLCPLQTLGLHQGHVLSRFRNMALTSRSCTKAEAMPCRTFRKSEVINISRSVKSYHSPSSSAMIEMSQTFLNPSDKDVLIFNTVLKVKSELLLTSTKEYRKKPCCTPSCTATLANSISCPSVVLTGDPIVGGGGGLTHLIQK